MCQVFWVKYLEKIKRNYPPSLLHYPTLDTFLAAYDHTGICNGIRQEEVIQLWEEANWMYELFKMINARGNKKLALSTVTKLIEGWEAKYVTGTGQKQATKIRVVLYETEGNVKPFAREKRGSHSGNNSTHGCETHSSKVEKKARSYKHRISLGSEEPLGSARSNYSDNSHNSSATSSNGGYSTADDESYHFCDGYDNDLDIDLLDVLAALDPDDPFLPASSSSGYVGLDDLAVIQMQQQQPGECDEEFNKRSAMFRSLSDPIPDPRVAPVHSLSHPTAPTTSTTTATVGATRPPPQTSLSPSTSARGLSRKGEVHTGSHPAQTVSHQAQTCDLPVPTGSPRTPVPSLLGQPFNTTPVVTPSDSSMMVTDEEG